MVESGGQCVMMDLIRLMLILSANNLVTFGLTDMEML